MSIQGGETATNRQNGRTQQRAPVVGGASADGLAGVAPVHAATRKMTRYEGERLLRARYLRRLQLQVADLRQRLDGVNQRTSELLQAEQCRPLTRDEARQARLLSRENERLCWELKHFFQEFEQIRAMPLHSPDRRRSS